MASGAAIQVGDLRGDEMMEASQKDYATAHIYVSSDPMRGHEDTMGQHLDGVGRAGAGHNPHRVGPLLVDLVRRLYPVNGAGSTMAPGPSAPAHSTPPSLHKTNAAPGGTLPRALSHTPRKGPAGEKPPGLVVAGSERQSMRARRGCGALAECPWA